MEVIQRDPRYAYEAYEFLFHALHHTQKMLGREPPPPAEGEGEGEGERKGRRRRRTNGITSAAGSWFRGCAYWRMREFGLMARTVFSQWGIERTDDFGEMVFNLVEAGLMSKTDQDTREDFHGLLRPG